MDKHEIEIAGCLRRLFRSRYVIRSRNESWFQSIIDNRQRIQQTVTAFGARLEINEPLGVAFVTALDDETEERIGFRLARPQSLSPYGSALLIHLRWSRMQFYLQPTGGEHPIISLLEMREFLFQFSRSKIDSQFERNFRKCVTELEDLQVIFETKADSGFFEITSLADLLLPADHIQNLKVRAEVYFSKSLSVEFNDESLREEV